MGRISVYTLLDKTEDAIKKVKNVATKEMPICTVRIRCAPNGEPEGARIYDSFHENSRDIVVLEVNVNKDGKIVLMTELGTFIKGYKMYRDYADFFYFYAMVVKYTNIWDKKIKNGVFIRNQKTTQGDDDMYLVVKKDKVIGKHKGLDEAIGQFCEMLCLDRIDEDAADMMEASFEMAAGKNCNISYGSSELGYIVLRVRDLMIIKEPRKNKPPKTTYSFSKTNKNIFVNKHLK